MWKKHTIIIFIFAVSVFFSACGQRSSDTTNDQSEGTSEVIISDFTDFSSVSSTVSEPVFAELETIIESEPSKPLETEPVEKLHYAPGDSLNELRKEVNKSNTILSSYRFLLFSEGTSYVIAGAFRGGDAITGYAVFSEDHNLQAKRGYLPMINLERPSELIGMTFDQVENQYGFPHDDLGSGAYYPCYITSNGNVIVLFGTSKVVYSVEVFDRSSTPQIINDHGAQRNTGDGSLCYC